MALIKTKTSENGIITEYHKIDSVNLYGSSMEIELVSYVSKDYRMQNLPVLCGQYLFNITLEEEESMGIRQLAYKKIKELPEWEGAEDC